MKLVFKIDYRTAWGEALYITGNIAALGNGDAGKLRAMQLDGLENGLSRSKSPTTPAT